MRAFNRSRPISLEISLRKISKTAAQSQIANNSKSWLIENKSSAMASHLMRFCYCAECETVVGESVSMVRWFESDFCDIKCLSKFIRKNVTECIECHTQLTTQMIHAIKAISPTTPASKMKQSIVEKKEIMQFSSVSPFTAIYFCSGPCMDAYKMKNWICQYCSILSPRKSSQANESITGKSVFCSEECQKLMYICRSGNLFLVSSCAQCKKKKNITAQCVIDNTEYLMCSAACRLELELERNVNLGRFKIHIVLRAKKKIFESV